MKLLGERWPWRHRRVGEEAVQLARGVRDELAVGGQHLSARLDRPECRAADHGPDLVQAEEEGGDDAEVAAAAPDRPVEVGVLIGGGANPLAAGEHDVGLDQVVDRETELAGQMAHPATQRETTDARGRDDSAGRREPVLVGRRVDFAPGGATTDAHSSCPGIDVDRLQARQVEDDAVVDRSQPGAVVATAAHREHEVVSAGERNHLGDVVGVGAGCDQGRAPVDHRVVDVAGLLIAGVLGGGQPSLESGHLGLGRLLQGAHTFLLVVVTSLLRRD